MSSQHRICTPYKFLCGISPKPYIINWYIKKTNIIPLNNLVEMIKDNDRISLSLNYNKIYLVYKVLHRICFILL